MSKHRLVCVYLLPLSTERILVSHVWWAHQGLRPWCLTTILWWRQLAFLEGMVHSRLGTRKGQNEPGSSWSTRKWGHAQRRAGTGQRDKSEIKWATGTGIHWQLCSPLYAKVVIGDTNVCYNISPYWKIGRSDSLQKELMWAIFMFCRLTKTSLWNRH